MKIKHRFTNELMHDISSATTMREAVEYAIQHNLKLSNANLAGADLNKIYFRGINLEYANLEDCRLHGANLANCTMSGARLFNADVNEHTNMAGVTLNALTFVNVSGLDNFPLIDGGLRPGYAYRFYLTKFPIEGFRVKAGCRDFTWEYAHSHWLGKRHQERGVYALLILKHLAVMATMRGWQLPELRADVRELYEETIAKHYPPTPVLVGSID